MPSHDPEPLANPGRRARLLAGLGWLAAGLPMTSDATTAVALPPPPPGAEEVDWDHFGEPTLSAARRANVAASRALQPATHETVDTRLFRLPGDATWEGVQAHYQQGAGPAWRAQPGADRVDPGNPARQQRFTASDDPKQRCAIVWLPATGEVRDGLLMVLRIR